MNAEQIVTPAQDAIGNAIDRGEPAEAKRLLGLLLEDFRRNKDYSINWITSLLSFIGERLGADGVEEALRDFGERYVRERRAGSASVDAWKRVEGVARAMKANGATVSLVEEEERYVLAFRCGTGGKLIDEGAYSGPRAYMTVEGPSPMTFGRPGLPVYCAHCSVNNEIQGIEWDGVPATVEFPPTGPGQACVHHVYKDASAIPKEIYRRVGK